MAGVVNEFLLEHNIERIATPAGSPELNRVRRALQGLFKTRELAIMCIFELRKTF